GSGRGGLLRRAVPPQHAPVPLPGGDGARGGVPGAAVPRLRGRRGRAGAGPGLRPRAPRGPFAVPGPALDRRGPGRAVAPAPAPWVPGDPGGPPRAALSDRRGGRRLRLVLDAVRVGERRGAPRAPGRGGAGAAARSAAGGAHRAL